MPDCDSVYRQYVILFGVAFLGCLRPTPFQGHRARPIGKTRLLPARQAAEDSAVAPKTLLLAADMLVHRGNLLVRNRTAFAACPTGMEGSPAPGFCDLTVDLTRCRSRASVGNSSFGCLLPPRQIWASPDDGRQPDCRRSNLGQSGQGMYPFVNPSEALLAIHLSRFLHDFTGGETIPTDTDHYTSSGGSSSRSWRKTKTPTGGFKADRGFAGFLPREDRQIHEAKSRSLSRNTPIIPKSPWLSSPLIDHHLSGDWLMVDPSSPPGDAREAQTDQRPDDEGGGLGDDGVF